MLKDPLPGQFDYILRDIQAGLVLPDHFAEEEEDQGDGEEYTRWWENPNDPDYKRFHSQYGGN